MEGDIKNQKQIYGKSSAPVYFNQAKNASSKQNQNNSKDIKVATSIL